ncbi:MAG TPA: endonuclease III, partial [Planctomycetaceae bacterium]|nr:endonuclease III [Planctomycetaceae bacterium]
MSPSDSASEGVAKKKHARKIVQALRKAYPDATCALHHSTPFQLLVATILSAQCTDERVNQVTPKLFARYPTPQALAAARPSDLERLVKSTGFYRAKAKSLREVSRALVDRHGGQIPRTLEELVELPGVGRKTANVVLGTAFGIPSGIVVDTHVKRISQLLGLTTNTNPDRIEQDLMEMIPKREWIAFPH